MAKAPRGEGGGAIDKKKAGGKKKEIPDADKRRIDAEAQKTEVKLGSLESQIKDVEESAAFDVSDFKSRATDLRGRLDKAKTPEAGAKVAQMIQELSQIDKLADKALTQFQEEIKAFKIAQGISPEPKGEPSLGAQLDAAAVNLEPTQLAELEHVGLADDVSVQDIDLATEPSVEPVIEQKVEAPESKDPQILINELLGRLENNLDTDSTKFMVLRAISRGKHSGMTVESSDLQKLVTSMADVTFNNGIKIDTGMASDILEKLLDIERTPSEEGKNSVERELKLYISRISPETLNDNKFTKLAKEQADRVLSPEEPAAVPDAAESKVEAKEIMGTPTLKWLEKTFGERLKTYRTVEVVDDEGKSEGTENQYIFVTNPKESKAVTVSLDELIGLISTLINKGKISGKDIKPTDIITDIPEWVSRRMDNNLLVKIDIKSGVKVPKVSDVETPEVDTETAKFDGLFDLAFKDRVRLGEKGQVQIMDAAGKWVRLSVKIVEQALAPRSKYFKKIRNKFGSNAFQALEVFDYLLKKFRPEVKKADIAAVTVDASTTKSESESEASLERLYEEFFKNKVHYNEEEKVVQMKDATGKVFTVTEEIIGKIFSGDSKYAQLVKDKFDGKEFEPAAVYNYIVSRFAEKAPVAADVAREANEEDLEQMYHRVFLDKVRLREVSGDIEIKKSDRIGEYEVLDEKLIDTILNGKLKDELKKEFWPATFEAGKLLKYIKDRVIGDISYATEAASDAGVESGEPKSKEERIFELLFKDKKDQFAVNYRNRKRDVMISGRDGKFTPLTEEIVVEILSGSAKEDIDKITGGTIDSKELFNYINERVKKNKGPGFAPDAAPIISTDASTAPDTTTAAVPDVGPEALDTEVAPELPESKREVAKKWLDDTVKPLLRRDGSGEIYTYNVDNKKLDPCDLAKLQAWIGSREKRPKELKAAGISGEEIFAYAEFWWEELKNNIDSLELVDIPFAEEVESDEGPSIEDIPYATLADPDDKSVAISATALVPDTTISRGKTLVDIAVPTEEELAAATVVAEPTAVVPTAEAAAVLEAVEAEPAATPAPEVVVRAPNNRPEPLLVQPDAPEAQGEREYKKRIIDIPERELMGLFPPDKLKNIMLGFANPDTVDQAHDEFVFFFTQIRDEKGFAEKIKRFGYKDVGEFLKDWKERLSWGPLKALGQWVGQIADKAVDRNITFSDKVESGLVWDTVKTVGRAIKRMAPTVILAGAAAALTTVATGGAALAGVAVAGGIGGFFGRFFKRSKKTQEVEETAQKATAIKTQDMREKKRGERDTIKSIKNEISKIPEAQLFAFLSQGLRDSSAAELGYNEDANPALLREHALRMIAQDVTARERRGETGFEIHKEAQEVKLDHAIAALYSKGTEDREKVAELIKKNPAMKTAIEKYVQLKDGGSTKDKDAQWKEVMGYVGAIAVGAGISMAVVWESTARIIPGGLAGGYLGVMYGHLKDREAQAEAFTEEAEDHIKSAEKILGLHEAGRPILQGNKSDSLMTIEAKLRTGLQFGLFDKRIDLQYRANNILRRIDEHQLENNRRVQTLDNLMSVLEQKTSRLETTKDETSARLKERSNWNAIKYGIAGVGVGAAATFLYGEYGTPFMRAKLRDMFGMGNIPLAGAVNEAGTYHPPVEAPVPHGTVPTEPLPQPRGSGIVQHEIVAPPQPKFKFDAITDPEARAKFINLHEKFPSLDREELNDLLKAAELKRGEGPESALNRQMKYLEQHLDGGDKEKFHKMMKFDDRGRTKVTTAIGRADHRLAIQKGYINTDNEWLKSDAYDPSMKQSYILGVDGDKFDFNHDQATGTNRVVHYSHPMSHDEIHGVKPETAAVEPKGGVIKEPAAAGQIEQPPQNNGRQVAEEFAGKINGRNMGEGVISNLPEAIQNSLHGANILSAQAVGESGLVVLKFDNGTTHLAHPVLQQDGYHLYPVEHAPKAGVPMYEAGTGSGTSTGRANVTGGGVPGFDSPDKYAAVLDAKARMDATKVADTVSFLKTDPEVTRATLADVTLVGDKSAYDKAFEKYAQEFASGNRDKNFSDPAVKKAFVAGWHERVLKGTLEVKPVDGAVDDVLPATKGKAPRAEVVPKTKGSTEPVAAGKPDAVPTPVEPVADIKTASADHPVVVGKVANGQRSIEIWDAKKGSATKLLVDSKFQPEITKDGSLKLTIGNGTAEGDLVKITVGGQDRWAYETSSPTLLEDGKFSNDAVDVERYWVDDLKTGKVKPEVFNGVKPGSVDDGSIGKK